MGGHPFASPVFFFLNGDFIGDPGGAGNTVIEGAGGAEGGGKVAGAKEGGGKVASVKEGGGGSIDLTATVTLIRGVIGAII